jgi:hypothetical protein
MKLRTLIIAVGLLALCSVIAYVKNRPEPAPPADPRVGTPLLSPDTVAKADAITVSDQGKSVELKKHADGTWHVASYFDMPADFEKISRLAQDLNEAKVERFVTDNPERIAHLEFKDSRIALSDAAGKEIWSVTLGKTPDSGNGRFIRFGSENTAFFSGTHVWLDTDAKGWADAQLVSVKADDIARVVLPLPAGEATVTLSRAKKDAPWTAEGGPKGQKLLQDKVAQLLTSLTGLRFTETVERKDPGFLESGHYTRFYTLTTFDGKTVVVALSRKPEVKKLKPPVADTAPITAGADGKPDVKPITPEYDTTPAGPVFAIVSGSGASAFLNAFTKERAFEVDDYAFTGLPQKTDDLFQPESAK